MHKFVHWLDPKLDRFRPKKAPAKTPPYTPSTLEDFISVLKRTPRNILSNRDRDRLAAIMNFDNRTVHDLMIPKSQMIFVQEDEVLGPLTLDRLYKSGFNNFPVIDKNRQVLGIIHTEALNTLTIKKTDHASKYLDPTINYLHATDSLTTAVEEIERTGSYFFLVQSEGGNLIGFFTIQQLLDYLLS